jgi:hypothetical protein
VWLEDVTNATLRFCIHERLLFSGSHSVRINYIALSDKKQRYGPVSEHKVVSMSGANEESTNKFCKTFKYWNRYLNKPRVFISKQVKQTGKYQINAFTACHDGQHVKVCVQTNHKQTPVLVPSEVKIHMIVTDDQAPLHNCTVVEQQGAVPKNLACYEDDSQMGHKFDCIKSCDKCLHSTKKICSSDLGFYNGECEMSMLTCSMYGAIVNDVNKVENVTVESDHAKCNGTGFQGGEKLLDEKPGAYYHSYVPLDMTKFHEYSDVLVVVSLFWKDVMADSHMAGVVWTSNVTRQGFEVFASYPGLSVQPWVYWIAYQVNIHIRTDKKLYGNVEQLQPFAGSMCIENANLTVHEAMDTAASSAVSLKTFTGTASRYVSSLHNQEDTVRGAIASWKNDNRTCVHETHSFQGQHTGWKLNWLREEMADTLVSSPTDTKEMDTGIICKNVTLTEAPTANFKAWVMLSVPYQNPKDNAYVGWIESIEGTAMRLCYDYTDPAFTTAQKDQIKFTLMVTQDDKFYLAQI